MEFRSDLRLTLKSSCDACTSSKVKCSGEDPCARCVRKGIQCFYSPKKKRGPVKKRERAALVANQPMVVSTNLSGNKQMSSLGSHERRSWSVFFTLYKHYAVSCSLFWFNRQLHKMRQYLIKKNRTDALKRLSAWMDALNIDVDELAGKVEACHLKIRQWGKESQAKANALADKSRPIELSDEDIARHLNTGNPFHLRVKGHQLEDVGPPGSKVAQQTALLGGFSEHEPNLRFTVDYMSPGSESKVTVTDAFESLMGYGSEEIEKDMSESGGGFLPWGGDVLSRILVNEADLLSFVQVTAIKFNTLGKPETYPICREVPSVHLFKINWKNSKTHGAMDCIVKCVHRELISDDESSLDVFMSFSPLNGMVPAMQMAPSLQIDNRFTIIDDEVNLPPKRLKQESSKPEGYSQRLIEEDQDENTNGTPEPITHVKYDLPASVKGPVVYDYVGARSEFAGLDQQSTSPSEHSHNTQSQAQEDHLPYREQQRHQHQHQPRSHHTEQPHVHQHNGPYNIEPNPPSDYIWTSKTFPSSDTVDEMFSSSKGTSATLSPASAQHSGNYECNPGASSTDDMLNLDLPLVDSSDEESLDIEDDAQWLDQLLKWTGPAVNPEPHAPEGVSSSSASSSYNA
mmetsp:Transcript_18796/g.36833  ORF Transcript_18796/g.36833 Transcript_18796/m.36833 type:complete len:628 (-) Transcript_18796:126-2009(-)